MNPGLYLHIPFCSAICPYCDFAVLTGGPERRARFTDYLIREIEMWSSGSEPFRGMDTIYFGGGTPSSLSSEQLGRIIEAAKTFLPVQEDPGILPDGQESLRGFNDPAELLRGKRGRSAASKVERVHPPERLRAG